MTPRYLADYLEASAAGYRDRVACVEPDGSSITYSALNRQADALARFLSARGVTQGDRVGVVLPKGLPAVVSLFGIMKAGAVFVPIDYATPADRGRRILEDCQIRALIVDRKRVDVRPEPNAPSGAQIAATIEVGISASAPGWPGATPFEAAVAGSDAPLTFPRNPGDLAFILYTSGSTGVPKGVMITHQNALSFVEWCSSVFEPTSEDRFSSHAPFHFDLSVLDIYLAIKHGATVHLIPDALGKNPKELAQFIAAHRVTIWYSTPSILMLLLQFGDLRRHDLSSLRLVLFAGEVFPVKHLRELQRLLPKPAYYNLYGPTETNVCTYARIPDDIPAERDTPYPIGFPCEHCDALVLDEQQREVPPGDEGLLYISGPSVFRGYWNRPAESRTAFLERGGSGRWYNTGDVVRWDPEAGYVYVGRRDRMVKRRGYRIELGEIERALYLHPRVLEAAVVSVDDPETGVKIVAHLSVHGAAPSIVEMKTFCSSALPVYMVPDRFVVHDRLPRTSTDKTDYQALKGQLTTARVG